MSHRFNAYTRTILALISTLIFSMSLSQAALETMTIKGQKYITLRSIKSNYGFSKMTLSGGKIELRNNKIKMEFTRGSKTCYMNNLKFGLCSSVASAGGRLLVSETDVEKMIDPILKPSYIANAKSFNTVVIDPGHGGKDAGAVNRYGTEARYNLAVARTLRAGLKAKGFKVVMTRDTDRYLTLNQRVAVANKYPNAIFISIHFNASSRSSARGVETFTLSPVGVAHYGKGLKSSDYKTRSGNYQDSANIALATAIHGRIKERVEGYNVPDRGIKRARFSVLSGIKHPAILIEGGFMSNPTEGQLIENSKYQATIATAVYEGIFRYRNALNSGAR
ncbi:MAG: N-acetylmuramoyl-L-alanine amidase family protein [Akkermansiaceae bacterium]